MMAKMSQLGARRLVSSGSLELAIPECEKGLGTLIGALDAQGTAAGLIEGVRVQHVPRPHTKPTWRPLDSC